MYDPDTIPTRVISSVLRVLGLIITAWRIHFRLRTHRFWWEDACAAVVMFSCLVSLIGEWVYLLGTYLSLVIGFWFYCMGTVSVFNATYLSIIFSVIRILPETRLRKFACIYAAFCGIIWIITITGKIWRCALDSSWRQDKTYRPPGCVTWPPIVIFEFATDCVTVGVLIAIPLRVLWKVKLPRRQRRMILSVFTSSVVLAIASVFHMVGNILYVDILMVAGADLEIACSIIVCNLLVVVTYVYRFFLRDGESPDVTTTSETDDDDFTQPRRPSSRSPMALTTVEIGTYMTLQDTSQSFVRSGTVPTDRVLA